MTPPEQFWKETRRIAGSELHFFNAAKTWDDFHELVKNIPSFPMAETPEARAAGGLSNVDVEQLVRKIQDHEASVDMLPDIWGLREAVVRLMATGKPHGARFSKDTQRDLRIDAAVEDGRAARMAEIRNKLRQTQEISRPEPGDGESSSG